MTTITTSGAYRNPDSTTLLNARVKGIFPSGVYGDTGLVTPSSGLAVTLAPTIIVGPDGMVHRTESAIDFDVVDGVTQRLVFRSRYNQKAAATARFEILEEADYLADADIGSLITIAQISPPSLATSVDPADISYDARDEVDALRRSPWRGVVATAASLPLPPTAVVREGDVQLALDTFLLWTYTGADGWQIIDVDGLVNSLDQRLKVPSQSSSAPAMELGRSGVVFSASPAAPVYAAQMPVHPALTAVGALDADMVAPAAMTSRAQRSSAANRAYVKGRANGAPTVQAGDLRIGRFAASPNGDLAATVAGGDADVGDPLVAATLVTATVDGLASYAYLKVGANPLLIEAGDLRLFLLQRNPGRMGLECGLSPVLSGDADEGDATAALVTYSTDAGDERFYASLDAGLTEVTAGETEVRLTEVANPAYAGKVTRTGSTDRGRDLWLRPGGALTGVEVDAETSGDAFLRVWQAGVESGKLNRERLATLIGGEAATHNPLDAGLAALPAAPKLSDSLHHHRDKARGDGVIFGLAPTSPGGLTVDVAGGWVYIDGEKWEVAAAPGQVAPDGVTSYIYVNGVSDPTAPVLALTTVAATALSTPGNVPIATVVTTGSGSIAAHGLRDMRRFVGNSDAKMVRTIGAAGHHATIQDAVDWLKSYQAGARDPGVVEFILLEQETLSSPVYFAGVRGMVLRGAPGAGHAMGAGDGAAVVWSHDGPAFDFGATGLLAGAAGLVFQDLHLAFRGTVGNLPNSAAFGNGSTGGAIGEGIVLRSVTTQPLTGGYKLRSFVRCSAPMLGWVIENCSVDVTDVGIGGFGGFVRCWVEGTSIRKSGTTSVGFGTPRGISDGGLAVTNIDTTFVGNKLHTPASSTISAGDGTGFGVGIELGSLSASDRNVIAKNVVHGGDAAGTTAIRADSSKALIQGNIIVIPAGMGSCIGIAVTQGGGQRVVDNIISMLDTAAVCTGIQIAVGGVEARGNHVDLLSTGTGTGILVQAGANAQVQGNFVNSPSLAGYGIRALSAATLVKVDGNRVVMSQATGATNNGIDVASAQSTVSFNLVTAVGASGASALRGWGVFVSGTKCVVNGNGLHSVLRGIYLAGTASQQGHSLVGNVVYATEHAAWIASVATGASSNTFNSSGGVALTTDTTAGDVALAANKITSSTTAANTVELKGTGIALTGGSVTGFNGIVIFASKVAISGCFMQIGPLATAAPFATAGGPTDISIVGNTIKADYTAGVLRLAVFGSATNVLFANNEVVARLNDTAFTITSGHHTKIAGNRMTFTAAGASAVDTCLVKSDSATHLTVENNEVLFNGMTTTDPNAKGILVQGAGCRVAGNRIDWEAASWVDAFEMVRIAAADAVVEGNTFNSVVDSMGTDTGVFIASGSDGVVVSNNRIKASVGHGIITHADGGVFSANNVSAPLGYAIDVQSSPEDLTFSANRCVGGVRLSGTEIGFTGNRVTVGDGAAVEVLANAEGVVISGCRLRADAGEGVLLGADVVDVTVDSNRVVTDGFPCVSVAAATRVSVRGNRLRAANQAANKAVIKVDGVVTGFVASDNTIPDVLNGSGILIKGTGAVDGCVMHGNIISGVAVIAMVTGAGIVILTAAHKNFSIFGNVVTGTGGGVINGATALSGSIIGNVTIGIADSAGAGDGWVPGAAALTGNGTKINPDAT